MKSCDWINLGYPGTANLWIVDSAKRFIELKKLLRYNHIYVVTTLTDIGRDFRHFHKEKQMNIKDYTECVKSIEKNLLEELHLLDLVDNLTLIVGRNFTSTFEQNIPICDNHLNMRWIDISYNYNPTKTKPEIFHTVIPPIEIIDDKDKQEFIEKGFYKSSSIIDFLMESKLHYKIASKHPTEISHKLWADYIFQEMKNIT